MLQQLTKLKVKKTNLLAPMLMVFLLCLIFTSTLLVQGMALVADDDETATTPSDDNEGDNDETATTPSDNNEGDNDEDDDGIDDDEEEVNERQVELQVSDNQVELESVLKNGETIDKIKIEFQTSGEPKFKLIYKSESESAEIDIAMKVAFYRLIEYLDRDIEIL